MKSDPYDFVAAIKLSRVTLRKMHQNLWLAVGHDAIVFPLVASILYLLLPGPEVAAPSMFGSILFAAINALMLKHGKFVGITRHGSARTSRLRSVEARP